MSAASVRKERSVITKETLKRIRKSLNKESKLKEIAQENDISISCARSLSEKISNGLSDEEILNLKKEDRHV